MNPVAGNTTLPTDACARPANPACRRQPPADHDLVLIGQLGHRTQQRMLRPAQPRGADIARRRRGQPIAAVLERIGRQRHRAGLRIQTPPRRAMPISVQPAQRRRQRSPDSGRSRCNVVITTEPARPASPASVSVIAGANTGCGDNSTKTCSTPAEQTGDTVMEPDRLTQVARPVVGVAMLGGVQRSPVRFDTTGIPRRREPQARGRSPRIRRNAGSIDRRMEGVTHPRTT